MVEVSNYCGVAYDTAFQEVWEAPAFVAQPQEEAVCMGSSITLTTEVEGGGTYGYALWQVEVNNKGEFVRNIRNLYIGVDRSGCAFGNDGYHGQTECLRYANR